MTDKQALQRITDRLPVPHDQDEGVIRHRAGPGGFFAVVNTVGVVITVVAIIFSLSRQNTELAAQAHSAQDGRVASQKNQDDLKAQATANEALSKQTLNETRLSLDCLYLRGQGVRPPTCDPVNSRIDELLAGGNPFANPVFPGSTPDLPAIPDAPGTVIVPAPAITVNPPPAPATTVPPASPPTTQPHLLCLLGICI